jgi:hypothetical protein
LTLGHWQAGQIDYHNSFFLRYIPQEIHVHSLVKRESERIEK